MLFHISFGGWPDSQDPMTVQSCINKIHSLSLHVHLLYWEMVVNYAKYCSYFFLSCKMISTYNYVVRNLPVSPAPLVRSHSRRSNIHQLYSVTAHHTIRVLNSIFIWSSYTYIRQSANMWLNSVHLVLIFYMLYIFISMSY